MHQGTQENGNKIQQFETQKKINEGEISIPPPVKDGQVVRRARLLVEACERWSVSCVAGGYKDLG